MENTTDKYMTVNDAINIKNKINDSMDKTKHKLILLCQKNIQFAASRNKEDTIWTVPTYLSDSISYNVLVMSLLVMSHFYEKGFYVKMLSMNSFYISWRNAKGTESRHVKIVEKAPRRTFVRKTYSRK